MGCVAGAPLGTAVGAALGELDGGGGFAPEMSVYEMTAHATGCLRQMLPIETDGCASHGECEPMGASERKSCRCLHVCQHRVSTVVVLAGLTSRRATAGLAADAGAVSGRRRRRKRRRRRWRGWSWAVGVTHHLNRAGAGYSHPAVGCSEHARSSRCTLLQCTAARQCAHPTFETRVIAGVEAHL